MDVTNEILYNHLIYGGSDNTNPAYTSSSKCLNYANGGTMQRAETQRVTVLPFVINYQDTVGLHGSENHFVKIQLKLDGLALECYEEEGWRCATISNEIPSFDEDGNIYEYTKPDQLAVIDVEQDTEEDAEYWFDTSSEPEWDDLLETPEAPIEDVEYMDEEDLALIDGTLDTKEDEATWTDYYTRAIYARDTYVPANLLPNSAKTNSGTRVKIDLNNLKTGNQYIDSWLDIRLYNKERMEHPYDIMYVAPREFFYIGFHARNTRRLPYNVECAIGVGGDGLRGLEQRDAVDPRLLATN